MFLAALPGNLLWVFAAVAGSAPDIHSIVVALDDAVLGAAFLSATETPDPLAGSESSVNFATNILNNIGGCWLVRDGVEVEDHACEVNSSSSCCASNRSATL